ncbi:MAG TPA: cyclase family protein [Candidatus Limnocylindria bacterium]
MPIWPGSAGFRIERALATADGDEVNVSTIKMDVHAGTHVEGPLHFIHDGATLDTIPLDAFVGAAEVIHVTDADSIGPEELQAVPEGTERLLIRTRNSEAWARQDSFSPDFAALTVDGARWIAERRMRLVGIDYLSIQLFGGDPETHRILMRGGTAILEGVDLSAVAAGGYRLTCLPLRLDGAEASPVRAILEALP